MQGMERGSREKDARAPWVSTVSWPLYSSPLLLACGTTPRLYALLDDVGETGLRADPGGLAQPGAQGWPLGTGPCEGLRFEH
jgi:hypothetical protein